MTTYTYPSTNIFKPLSIEWKLAPNVSMFVSPFSGQVQTLEVPGARWLTSLNYDFHRNEDLATIEAWFSRLRGPVNRIGLWHFARPLPLGTLQSNTTTSGTTVYGATSIVINTTTGLTLLAGDMLGITLSNSSVQLVQVVQDATSAAGSMTVSFSPPLRWATINNAAIIVDKPTTTFIIMDSPRILYTKTASPGFTAELMEVF